MARSKACPIRVTFHGVINKLVIIYALLITSIMASTAELALRVNDEAIGWYGPQDEV